MYRETSKLLLFSNLGDNSILLNLADIFWDWENKKDNLLSLGGLVTNWNNYNIIEKLQEQCDFILKSMINNQKREAEKIASTLEKIRS